MVSNVHLLSVAADVADAIDPSHTTAQRLAAVHRARTNDPGLAVTVACDLLHGMLLALAGHDMRAAAQAMHRMRTMIADLPADE